MELFLPAGGVFALTHLRGTLLAMKKPAQRPLVYHKRSQIEPYLLALRRLHHNRWPDWRIAEALSSLTAHQIECLETNRCWNWRDVEEVMVPGAGP